MKFDSKKMDLENLDELIAKCEESMIQPFRKKKVEEARLTRLVLRFQALGPQVRLSTSLAKTSSNADGLRRSRCTRSRPLRHSRL